MALERSQPSMTYANYLALPAEGRHELIDGVLIMTPSASSSHQRIQARLVHAFATFLDAHPIGEVFADLDVVLREPDPALIVRPDLTYVAAGGRAVVREPNVAGPPALVVEILSPSNARHDAIAKRAIYDVHGVGEYWMVLPDVDQIEVVRRADGGGFGRPAVFEAGDVLTTPVLPGFELEVARLFAPPRTQPA